jgi:hypothetical protein
VGKKRSGHTQSILIAVAMLAYLTCAVRSESRDSQSDFLLSQHTMAFAGSISVDTHITLSDSDDGNADATLEVFPWMGYFVIDNLELMGNLAFEIPFNDWAKTFGFSLGARYIWDFPSVCLYLGGAVGFHWSVDDDWPTSPEVFTVPTLLLGLLIPFNRHVALDVGLRLFVTLPIDEDNPYAPTIDIPVGYLGVRGHFNF